MAFLHGLCFNSCLQLPTLRSCSDFAWWVVMWKYKPNKPFPQVAFGQNVYRSSREETDTMPVLVWVHMYKGTHVHMWRSEDNFWKVVFFLLPLIPRAKLTEFFFKRYHFYFVYICLVCIYVCCMHTYSCLAWPERGVRSPEAGVSCELIRVLRTEPKSRRASLQP